MAFNFPVFTPPRDAIPIFPGTNIQSVVDRYPPGTTFLLKAGVHRGQTITPRDGTSFYGEVGPDGSLRTILSGEDQTRLAFDWWRGTNVTIRNLVIERYVTGDHVGAIFTNQGWLVEGNEIRNNQKLGIYIHRGRTTVCGNYIHNNGMLGITGSGEDILVEDNEISSNNTGSFNSAYQAGGLKFGGLATRGLIIRGNYVHDNNAKGVWTDVNLPGALIEDNLVVRNRDEGIKVEISYGNIVRNNRLADNGRNGGWMYGSQILISTSADSRVYGNTVEVNAEYGKGISIIQQNRGSGPLGPYETRNNQVYNNRIIYRGDSAPQDLFNALSGVAQDVRNNAIFTLSNRFYNNQYYWPTGTSPNRFAWNNRYIDLAAFEAANGETGSSYSNNIPTLNWNWNDGGQPPSVSPSPTPSPTPSPGTGNGLQGEYFNNIDFTAPILTRTDSSVNFNWGSGAPSSSIEADTFSARWTGQVQPLYSETYNFYTTADDGISLWVDGKQIINNFVDQAPTERSGSVTLEAGKKYDIRMEYYENGGGAVAQLAWSSPSQTKQIIPQSQLYSSTPPLNTSPTAFRIEGETIDQITGFRTESIGSASGGRVLSLVNGSSNEAGSASFTFNGGTGLYDIFLGTFDETDGISRFDVACNGISVGSIILNQQLGSAAPNETNKVRRQVASRVQLGQGDTIRVQGFENGAEFARLDFIELVQAPVI
jgi:parallel beta-helix repeat protein